MRAQGRRPGDLELAVPQEPAAACDRPPRVISDRELCVVRKDIGESLEQGARLRWRAEVAHVLREHAVKRPDLCWAKAHLNAIFLWAPDLAAELGRQGFPQRGRIRRQIQQYRELAMRDRQI